MLTEKLQENISFIKDALPAEDIIVYRFRTQSGTECAAVYADGLVDKAVLGDLAARPLIERLAFEDGRTSKDDVQEEKAEGGAGERQPGEAGAEKVKETLLFPEIKEETEPKTLFKEVLDGNCLFLVDGIAKGFIVGAKKPPVRAVAEPPTDVAVKGPREGFIEDIKTNMALLRKRLKTPDLRFEMSKVGRRSETNVAVCWLEGISDSKIKDEIVRRIREIDIDYIPDSSYIADFLVPRKHSFFRQIGTTENRTSLPLNWRKAGSVFLWTVPPSPSPRHSFFSRTFRAEKITTSPPLWPPFFAPSGLSRCSSRSCCPHFMSVLSFSKCS